MRNPDGVFICTDASGAETSIDAYRCCHCGLPRAVRAKSRDTDIGGWCMRCAANVCPRCEAIGKCVPFERQLELAEARGQALRSYGL